MRFKRLIAAALAASMTAALLPQAVFAAPKEETDTRTITAEYPLELTPEAAEETPIPENEPAFEMFNGNFDDTWNTNGSNSEITLLGEAQSGSCGENLTWNWSADGTLTISGEGEMTSHPWTHYSYSIKNVVIENGVTSICARAFSPYSGLTSVTIPDSVTSIGDYAFSGCSSLESMTIPDSVTSIDSWAFSYCSSLESITIPDGVTSIGWAAFFSCSGLISVTISDGVTSIGDCAFAGCSSLESMTIPDSVKNIGEEAFYYCSGLISVTIPDSVTSIGRAAFDGCENVVLYVKPGSYAEEYAVQNGINYQNYIPDLNQTDFILTVKDNADTVINSGYVVNWFDKDQYIGSGNKITYGKTDGIYYDIYLDEETGLQYYQPARQKAEGDFGSLSCVLKKIPYVNISAKVTDEAGAAVSDADVIILQSANGYTKKEVRKTASDGTFSASVLNTNTQITVKKNLYYDSSYTIISGDIKDVYDEAQIVMKKMPSDKITLDITAAKAVSEGSGAVSALTDASALEFTLFNKTNNREITDFTLQYPYIILGESAAAAGDYISVGVKDRSGRYTGEDTVVLLDETRNGSADIKLVENGSFTMNTLNADEKLVLLFDEAGKLVWKTASNGATVASDRLAAGSYRAVVMKKTALFSGTADIESLNTIGLIDGTDYVLKPVTIQNGVITDLGDVNVPELDETKLYYTDTENTSIYFSKNKSYVGLLMRVTAKYKLKEDFEGEVKSVTVNLPDGVDFVEDSVALKGGEAAYNVNDNTVTVFTDKNEGTISFYILCKTEGEHSVEGYINLKTGGNDIKQPIGSCVMAVEPVVINAPERTSKNRIAVSGTVTPRSEVIIFKDGTEVGRTTANSAGSWAATVDLSGSYAYQNHRIYCEFKNDYGAATTETAQVVYDPNYSSLDTITIRSNSNVKTMDFNDVSTKVESYTTYYYGITYEVKLSDNSPEKVSDVYVVTANKSGGETYVPCVYSAQKDAWIGSYDYGNSSNMPVSISAEYKMAEEKQSNIIDEETLDDFTKKFSELQDGISEGLDNRLEVIDIVDETDTGFSVQLGLRDDNDEIMDFGTLIYDVADISEFDLSAWEETGYTECTNEAGETMYILNYLDEESGIYYNECAVPSSGLYLKSDFKFAEDAEPAQMLALAAADVETAAVGYDIADWVSGAIKLLSGAGASVIDDFTYSMRANDFAAELRRKNGENYELIMETCDNTGSFRLSAADRLKYLQEYDRVTNDIDNYRNKCTEQIRMWALLGSLSDLAGISWGKKGVTLGKGALGMISKINIKLPGKSKAAFDAFNKAMGKVDDFANPALEKASGKMPEKYQKITNDVLDNALGNFVSNTITGGIGKVLHCISQMDAMYYIENRHKDINDSITNTKNNIKNSQIDCDEEPDEPKKPKLKRSNPFKPITPIIDPSGYVYEAVPSNRLENVKTTISYRGDVVNEYGDPTGEKTAIVWNAEDYDQSNPLYTDAQGGYMWDVPEGDWQVMYEKEGYDTAYSEWLPVPPPQLDINQALVSTEAPEVMSVNVYNDEIEIIFSKYMKLSAAEKITAAIGGTAIDGEVTAVNAEYNAENTEQYASVFKFTPAENISGDVTVTVKGAEGYNSIAAQDYSVTKTAIIRPEYISAIDSVNITFGDTAVLNAEIMPKEAAANVTVEAKSLSNDIVSVAQESVVPNEDGKVSFTLKGELLGKTEVELTIPGTTISKTVSVNVIRVVGCKKVTASIESGTEVEKGTKVALSTETEGAEIYYTLDKTCPCVVDSPSRIKYTEPITINEGMYIIAYAVKDGFEDSPTAGFSYTVKGEEIMPVRVENAHVGNTIIAATYKADGTIIGCKIKIAEAETEIINISYGQEAEYIKIMEWDSLHGMKPAREAVTQTVSR